jgi:hypothetical protein
MLGEQKTRPSRKGPGLKAPKGYKKTGIACSLIFQSGKEAEQLQPAFPKTLNRRASLAGAHQKVVAAGVK